MRREMATNKVAAPASEELSQWRPPAIGTCKPSWLLSTIADLEARVKALAVSMQEEDDGAGDTFSERAESYYRKRPQLLTLVYDLHNAYLSLADRYSQALAKNHSHHRRSSSQTSAATLDRDGEIGCVDSDAESSLSYQPLAPQQGRHIDGDAVIAELVMKCVEYDVAMEEMKEADRLHGDSGRRIELQRCLLEVLEAERRVLLSENARLGCRADALAEENAGMAGEVAALRRKAGELARCALRMREDHRVCLMGRRIEDLQAQIRGLEKRNGEYCEMLMKRSESQQCKWIRMVRSGHGDVVGVDPAEKAKPKPEGRLNGGGGSGARAAKWWTNLRKNLDLFQCVPRSEFPR